MSGLALHEFLRDARVLVAPRCARGGSRGCRLIRLDPADVGDDKWTHRAGGGASLRVPPAGATNPTTREFRGALDRRLLLQDIVDDGAAVAGPLRAPGLNAGSREAEATFGPAHCLGSGDEIGIHPSWRSNVGEGSSGGHDAEQQRSLVAERARARLGAIRKGASGGGPHLGVGLSLVRHSSRRTAGAA